MANPLFVLSLPRRARSCRPRRTRLATVRRHRIRTDLRVRPGDHFRELEVRYVAERADQALPEGVVVPQCAASPPKAEHGGDQIAVYVVVERLHGPEALEVRSRPVRLVLAQLGKRPERVAREL